MQFYAVDEELKYLLYRIDTCEIVIVIDRVDLERLIDLRLKNSQVDIIRISYVDNYFSLEESGLVTITRHDIEFGSPFNEVLSLTTDISLSPLGNKVLSLFPESLKLFISSNKSADLFEIYLRELVDTSHLSQYLSHSNFEIVKLAYKRYQELIGIHYNPILVRSQERSELGVLTYTDCNNETNFILYNTITCNIVARLRYVYMEILLQLVAYRVMVKQIIPDTFPFLRTLQELELIDLVVINKRKKLYEISLTGLGRELLHLFPNSFILSLSESVSLASLEYLVNRLTSLEYLSPHTNLGVFYAALDTYRRLTCNSV